MKKSYPKWYLNPTYVRQYKNFRWNNEDRKLLLDLRNQKKSIKEIIEILARRFNIETTSEHLTNVKIYNQIRIARATYTDRCCYCGKKLQLEDNEVNKKRTLKSCTKCVQKSFSQKKIARETAIKNGICGICKKAKILSGFTTCKKCLSYTRRTRKLKNVCNTCGKNPVNKSRSTVLCDECLDKKLR